VRLLDEEKDLSKRSLMQKSLDVQRGVYDYGPSLRITDYFDESAEPETSFLVEGSNMASEGVLVPLPVSVWSDSVWDAWRSAGGEVSTSICARMAGVGISAGKPDAFLEFPWDEVKLGYLRGVCSRHVHGSGYGGIKKASEQVVREMVIPLMCSRASSSVSAVLETDIPGGVADRCAEAALSAVKEQLDKESRFKLTEEESRRAESLLATMFLVAFRGSCEGSCREVEGSYIRDRVSSVLIPAQQQMGWRVGASVAVCRLLGGLGESVSLMSSSGWADRVFSTVFGIFDEAAFRTAKAVSGGVNASSNVTLESLKEINSGASDDDLRDLSSELNRAKNRSQAGNALERANKVLGGFGVEAVFDKDEDVVLLYVNTGDTYSATVVWNEESGEMAVSNWGDEVDALERGGVELKASSAFSALDIKKGKVDRGLRNKAANKFADAGLDGNGRFDEPGDGVRAAFDVLEEFGIEIDGTAGSFHSDSGTTTINLAFTNMEDRFSPYAITNSSLVFTWYKFEETGKYEIVVYLS